MISMASVMRSWCQYEKGLGSRDLVASRFVHPIANQLSTRIWSSKFWWMKVPVLGVKTFIRYSWLQRWNSSKEAFMSFISRLITFPDITVLCKYIIAIMHLPIKGYSEISLFYSRSKLILFLNIVWERDNFENNQTISLFCSPFLSSSDLPKNLPRVLKCWAQN